MSKKNMKRLIVGGGIITILLGIFFISLSNKEVRIKLAEKNLKNFKASGEEEVVINISFDNPLNIDEVFSLVTECNGEIQSMGHIVKGEGNDIVGEFIDCENKSNEDIKREYIKQLSDMVDLQMENIDYRLKELDKETNDEKNEGKDTQLKSLLDLKSNIDKQKADLDKGIIYIYGVNVKVKGSSVNALKDKSSVKLIEILNCDNGEEVTPINLCK